MNDRHHQNTNIMLQYERIMTVKPIMSEAL